MHLCPTLAVHKAAAQIPGFPPGLFSLCHNALHLHKLRPANDLRQGVFYSDRIGFTAPVLPAFFLFRGECICPGVFLVSEHFIDLHVLDGLAPLASESCVGQLLDDGGEALSVGGCVEYLPDLASLQLIHHILLIDHIIAKRGISPNIPVIETCITQCPQHHDDTKAAWTVPYRFFMLCRGARDHGGRDIYDLIGPHGVCDPVQQQSGDTLPQRGLVDIDR